MKKNFQQSVVRPSTRAAELDQGLRAYMVNVYNYMALGLGLTGVVAFLVGTNLALLNMIVGNPLVFWLVALAPIGFVFYLSFKINTMSVAKAQTVFWIYAGMMGLSLSFIFAVYTGMSIAKVFFITAGTFGVMSLYGYTTQKDLTSLGSFLFMGLIGIILASVVNIFLHSSGLSFLVSILGVIIFTGLTAYDTQRIKNMYYEGDGAEVSSKKAIMGALALYLDFINLFISLLQILGNRR
jgi:hypothetical protein